MPTTATLPTPDPEPIELWPERPDSTEQTSLREGHRILRNINRPALLSHWPAPGRANGQAVLVVPGGGQRFVAIDNEGHAVARRLADAGYAAHVLKYRVLPTPADDARFAAEYDAFIYQVLTRPAENRGRVVEQSAAVDDARQALRMLRSGAVGAVGAIGAVGAVGAAGPSKVQRIGFIGFSAGALIGRALIEVPEPDALPDTLALAYGSMLPLSPESTPPARLPPLFVMQADDDPLFARQGFGLIQSWQRAGQRVELHHYERGGHGYGMAAHGSTSDGWVEAYLAWLARQ